MIGRYDSFQNVNNKGADLFERMRRLICTFVVNKPPKTGFLRRGPYYGYERSDCC